METLDNIVRGFIDFSIAATVELYAFTRRLLLATIDVTLGTLAALVIGLVVGTVATLAGTVGLAGVASVAAFVLVVIIGVVLAGSPFVAIAAVATPIAGCVACIHGAREWRESTLGWRA